MDQKLCPSNNFIAIYAVRKEAYCHSVEPRFTDHYMWNTFIDGLLPKGAYDSNTDGFPNSQLSEDKKLQKLDKKWEKLTAKKEKSFITDSTNYNDRSDYQSFLQAEASFIAYGQKHGFQRSRSKDSSRSMESGGSTRSDGYFKYGSSKHRGIACPFAERAFEYAKKLRVKQDGEESDEDQRTYQPIKVRGSSPHQEHYWRSSSPRPLSSCGRTNYSPSPRTKDEMIRSTNWRDRSKSVSSDKSVSFRDKANIADENDQSRSEDCDEFGGLSWERRSEIPITSAAADTGCTSHMTDVDTLFSEPLKPCRRSIQVGRGSLWSDGIGTAVIKLENGRHVFLEDMLHVPGIGCTLVSTKKLLGSKLIGQFDAHRILFSRRSDNVPLIEAKMRNGLYIVSQIAEEADGMSFVTSEKQVKPVVESDKITAFIATPSSTILIRSARLLLPPTKTPVVNKEALKPLASSLVLSPVLRDEWTKVIRPISLQQPSSLKPTIRSKTRFLNRYAAFEAVETEPEDPQDDEANSSSDDQETSKIEQNIDQGEFPEGIAKRDRNRIARQIRKVAIQQGHVQPKERTADSFTLKEKRL